MCSENAASRSYVVTRKRNAYSELVVDDFERALFRYGMMPLESPKFPLLWDFLGRAVGKANVAVRSLRNAGPAIVGLMGLAERQLYPYILSHNIVPFIWDCWPDREREWRLFILRHNFSRIAFTSSHAANYWSSRLPHLEVHWIPEAVDNAAYPPGPPLSARPSVLLEIGRRYENAHNAARSVLDSVPSSHLYQIAPGEIFLPRRDDLVQALHAHRALLCYPASISHPSGRTGSWETMTHRYLEAIATKSLVIGHIPHEMKLLFGFEPGLTVSLRELPDVLDHVMDHPELYQDLVDRSYNRLMEVGTWDVRARDVDRLLLSCEN